MDKLTKWAETIVWQAYPECKPEKDNGYLVLLKNSDITDSYNTIEFAVYDIKSGQFRMLEYGHHEDFMLSLICAFAELPTGSIGDEFGFETALLLMKEGEECECATWGNTEFHEKWMFYEGDYCIYSERYNGYILASPEGHAFGVQHINGKWRLA